MTIVCPRCGEKVSKKEAFCPKCGFSISNYIKNMERLDVSVEEVRQEVTSEQEVEEKKVKKQDKLIALINGSGEDSSDRGLVATAVKEESSKSNDDIEENIIRIISNIKIVKDDSVKDEDMNSNVQSFLVEALNETYNNETLEDNKEVSIKKASILDTKENTKDGTNDSAKNIINNSTKEESVENQTAEHKDDNNDAKSVKFFAKKVNDDVIISNVSKKVANTKEKDNEVFNKFIETERNSDTNKRAIALVGGFILVFIVATVLLTQTVLGFDGMI